MSSKKDKRLPLVIAFGFTIVVAAKNIAGVSLIDAWLGIKMFTNYIFTFVTNKIQGGSK